MKNMNKKNKNNKANLTLHWLIISSPRSSDLIKKMSMSLSTYILLKTLHRYLLNSILERRKGHQAKSYFLKEIQT